MKQISRPQHKLYSPAKRIGKLLAKTFEEDPNFYFFSPDETTSNKFDQIFEIEKRAWGDLPQEPWDLPEAANGRIIEMLSENVLFSVMTGHLMNGEKAMMGSYEAFYPIITSQLLQHIKFIKQAKAIKWRESIPAVNLLSTSTCWRQDHNGFTHQSPALISMLLSIPSNLANCIFPIDDLAAEKAYEYMLAYSDVVNLTTFDKNERPRYLDESHTGKLYNNGGAMILEEYSDPEPDIIIVGCGDIVTHEAIKAIEIVKHDISDIKIRFININALSYRAIGTIDNKLSKADFVQLFTQNKPIIANFHGYPETLENILENYTSRGRIRVHGFNEEGSTTTPFEMLRRNAASRYDIAIDIATYCRRRDLVSKYINVLKDNHDNAISLGEDLETL